MTYGEAVSEITTGLEALNYKAYKGKEYSLEKGSSSARPEDKAFLIRLDNIKESSITNNGSIGTYLITLEVNFTFTDLATLQTKNEAFADLTSKLFTFENFLGFISDPSIKMLDNRFLGIYKIYYGLNNDD